MKIYVSLSFLLVFILPIIAHNEANSGSDIKRENPLPKNGVMGNHCDKFYELYYDTHKALN